MTKILLLFAFFSFVNGLNTVLYGPAARELLLLTAKLAARQGMEASCITAPGTEDGCRRLMYGLDYVEQLGGGSGDQPGHARPVSSGEDIGAALESADSLLFVAYDNPIDAKTYNTLLNSAGENLAKVVLMSKMGASKAKGGFFGGNDNKMLESETTLREICRSKGLNLSMVRAGVLKGGGPGESGNDFGLDTCYYNTLLDSSEAAVTMAHDKFTLGLNCFKGDTVEMPNMFTLMGTKSSFEACPYDTNRVVVAGGIVAAALYDRPIEVSVGAEKATKPPTLEEWNEVFSRI